MYEVRGTGGKVTRTNAKDRWMQDQKGMSVAGVEARLSVTAKKVYCTDLEHLS